VPYPYCIFVAQADNHTPIRRQEEITEESPHPWQGPTGELIVDYCVIGGGIAGLYAAVRLAELNKSEEPKKIYILEATKRVGGRVVTIKIPRSQFYADLGAMLFIHTQPLIISFVDHLRLQTFNYAFPSESYFVRGRSIGAKRVLEEAAPVYLERTNEEIPKEPGDLVVHAIGRALQEVEVQMPTIQRHQEHLFADAADLNTILPNCKDRVEKMAFRAFSPRQWRTIRLHGHYPGRNGLPLFKLGFWDVIQSQLSSEAYSFVDEGLGYQTIVGTWNAADAIPWFLADFGAPN
jgi:hypothetical protein